MAENVECDQISEQCLKGDGFFAVETDCSSYVQCYQGISYKRTCPKDLLYNPVKRTCDTKTNCGAKPSLPTSRSLEVDCDCDSCIMGDSEDCSRYYLCLDGVAYDETCGDGLLFDSETATCDYAGSATCASPSPQCATRNGDFSDPGSCSSYHHCVGGVAHRKECAPGFHFSKGSGQCEEACQAGCDPSIECPTTSEFPVCQNREEMLPNPEDCHTFYDCSEGAAKLSECTDGEHFNALEQICQHPCEALCDPDLDCFNFTSTSADSGTSAATETATSTTLLLTSEEAKISDSTDVYSTSVAPTSRTESSGTEESSSSDQTPTDLYSSVHPETSEISDSTSVAPTEESSPGPTDFYSSVHPKTDDLFTESTSRSTRYITSSDLFPDETAETSPAPYSALCPEPTGVYPDPEECRALFLCIDGYPMKLYCDDHLHFNAFTSRCESPCSASCDPTLDCSTTEEPETPTPLPLSLCRTKDFLPKRGFCRYYYDCTRSRLRRKQKCPKGLQFNPTKRVCDLPQKSGCGEPSRDLPVPDLYYECPCEACLVPSPHNCLEYFLCLNFTAYRMKCSDGLLFDKKQNTCNLANKVVCDSSTTTTAHPYTTETPQTTKSYTTNQPYTTTRQPYTTSTTRKSYTTTTSRPYTTSTTREPYTTTIRPYTTSTTRKPYTTSTATTSRPYTTSTTKEPYTTSTTREPYTTSTTREPYTTQTTTTKRPYTTSTSTTKRPYTTSTSATKRPYTTSTSTREPYTTSSSTTSRPYTTSTTIKPYTTSTSTTRRPSTSTSTTRATTTTKRPYTTSTTTTSRPYTTSTTTTSRPYTTSTTTTSRPYTTSTTTSRPYTTSTTNKPKSTLSPTKYPVRCPEANGMFRNPKDCGSFIHCANFIPFLKECPGGLHFSVQTQRCEYPCKAKCDESLPCSPLCPCRNCLRPSQESCTEFIECKEGRPTQRECPKGQTFDARRSKCDWAHRVDCQHSEICPRRNGLFPYKGDCNKFVHCANGIPRTRVCPPRLQFDPVTLRCTYAPGPCGSAPSVNGSKSKSRPPVPGHPEWHCPGSFGYYRHDERCDQFYHCVEGVATLKQCAEGLYFNSKIGTCDWAKEVNCRSSHSHVERRCRRFTEGFRCPSNRSYVPAAPHCDMFFDCRTGQACAKRCPDGLYFNPDTGTCDLPANVKCRKSDGGSYGLKRFAEICRHGFRQQAVDPATSKCYYKCHHDQVRRYCCSGTRTYDEKRGRCERKTAFHLPFE